MAEIRVRAQEPEDAAAIAAIFNCPGVIGGTLQLPYQSVERRRERMAQSQEAHHMDLIDLHNRALDQTEEIVAGVSPDQMELSTPCEEWDVRELLNHLVGGNRTYAGIPTRNVHRRAAGEDVIGNDPLAAYRSSAADLKQAWSDPRFLDEILPSHLSERLGDLPGRAWLNLHLVEVATHGWDLARATGQQTDFDPEVVQSALVFAETVLGNRIPGSPFHPKVEVGEDAPAIDRLAASLGRNP